MKKNLFITIAFFFFSFKIVSQCAGNCTLYTTSSIPYSLTAVAGTSVVLGDDQVSSVQPIGFTFSFMCTAYTNFYISSNGFISFNAGVSQGCCSGQVLPSPGNVVNNMIAFCWNDLYPPGGGTIRYQTVGTAPNRVCIIEYLNVPHCCNNGPAVNTGQIKLYETTNVIEIHNTVVTNDGSTATQGIMDATGNTAVTVAGRNGAIWTVSTPDAYRFDPSPPLPNCSGTPTGGTAQATPTIGGCSLTSTLTLTGATQACSLTYQWQSATAIGGPYSNIVGATSVSAVVVSTVTTYYRCLISCGASTGTSAAATCSVNSCSGAPVAGTAVANPAVACGTLAGVLSITGASTLCGLSYQWQSAAAIGGPYSNIVGATSPTAAFSTTVTTYYRCVVSCGGSGTNGSPATASISAPPCPIATGAWYITSNTGQPWGSNSNVTGMNAVFSNTWTQGFFQTVNPAAAFNPTVCFVFLEGGDGNATSMNTFVTANIVAIQNWVSAGGRLFINAGPNVGGNMNWGFGGITLNYAVGPYSGDAYAAPGQAGHPIFNGPALPAGTGTYTGNWWCHGYVSGGGVANIIVGQTPGASLAELSFGLGRVMAGSMTTANFHLPAPNSQNLLNNILSYLGNCNIIILPVQLKDYYLNHNDEFCDVIWETSSERNVDYFEIQKSTDGINYEHFANVSANGNTTKANKYSVRDKEPNIDGVTYYKLKVFDKGNSVSQGDQIRTLTIKENAVPKLKVQPNPSSSYLDIYLPPVFMNRNLTLQIFDNSGTQVYTTSLFQSTSAAYNLNTAELKNGLYSVLIFDENGSSVKTSFIKN